MEGEDILRQIVRRLDVLISLELANGPAEAGLSVAARIQRLAELGLAPSEIAAIIRKPTSYVTATRSRQKKAASKKGG